MLHECATIDQPEACPGPLVWIVHRITRATPEEPTFHGFLQQRKVFRNGTMVAVLFDATMYRDTLVQRQKTGVYNIHSAASE